MKKLVNDEMRGELETSTGIGLEWLEVEGSAVSCRVLWERRLIHRRGVFREFLPQSPLFLVKKNARPLNPSRALVLST